MRKRPRIEVTMYYNHGDNLDDFYKQKDQITKILNKLPDMFFGFKDGFFWRQWYHTLAEAKTVERRLAAMNFQFPIEVEIIDPR